MSATGSEAPAEGPSSGGDRSRLSRLANLFGPTTILPAILYYYGYVSLKSYYSYFGISLSALDLSPTDFLVRTPDTLFRPIASLMIILVVLFLVHNLLDQGLNWARTQLARRVSVGFAVAGGALAAIGFVGLYRSPEGLLSPLSLVAAALLLEYSLWVFARYGAPPPRFDTLLHAAVDLRRGLVIALVVIGAFWTVNELAQTRGTANAELTARSLPLQSQAVVYSAKDLQLPGPDVGEQRLEEENSAFAFRYNGLRPLLYANGRWFLLPVGWRHDNGATVIVLVDNPSNVRVDLAPGTRLPGQ